MPRTKTKVQYIVIVWGVDHGGIYYLKYGDGSLRTYPRDHYDGRLKENLPFFDDSNGAIKYMMRYPKEQIQLDIDIARQWFPDARFG